MNTNLESSAEHSFAYKLEMLVAAKASIKGIGDRKFLERTQSLFSENKTLSKAEASYLDLLYLDVLKQSQPYAGAYATPVEPCPYCGTLCDADWVDVGVGLVQCGPYHCLECGSSEQGPYDEKRPLSDQERATGWYEPGSMPGSSANVINGEIVGHKTAQDAYVAMYPLSATTQGQALMRG